MQESFLLNYATHYYDESESSFLNQRLKGIWIFKPSDNNCGRGIEVVSNIADFKESYIRKKNLVKQEPNTLGYNNLFNSKQKNLNNSQNITKIRLNSREKHVS